MRFKTLWPLIAAAAVILLAGCINYDQELTLNADGSGQMKIHYSNAGQQPPGKEKTGEGEINLGQAPKLPFTEEEIKKGYEGAKGVTVKDIIVETKDNVPHATYTITFKDIHELNGKGIFALEGDKLRQTFSLTDETGAKLFKQLVQLKMAVEDPSTLSAYKFTYKFTAPGEILETNGTKGEANTVTWEFPLDKLINKDTEMTVKFKAKKAILGGKLGIILGIICLVVIVVVIVVVVVILSKKKKAPAAPAAPSGPAA